MKITMINPIRAGNFIWRQDSPLYFSHQVAQNDATTSQHDEKITISNKAKILSDLKQASATPGYSGDISELLTDAERMKFKRISDQYNGKKDREIGDLAISLAMDKLMSFASKTKVPTLDKEYLLKLINELSSNPGEENTLHSRLNLSFLSDLLHNSAII